MPILCIEWAKHPNRRQTREGDTSAEIDRDKKNWKEEKMSTNHLRIMENIHHFFFAVRRLFCFLSVRFVYIIPYWLSRLESCFIMVGIQFRIISKYLNEWEFYLTKHSNGRFVCRFRIWILLWHWCAEAKCTTTVK